MRASARPGEDGQVVGSPPLRIGLLGELNLSAGDERLPPVESARVRSLLGYLVLHRHAPHARQRLAFLLWPDSAEGQARTNLRKVLHTLRHDMPQVERYLDVTPRTLQWRHDEPVWVDVAAFEASLAQADDADVAAEDAAAALRQAVDLYRGDLLEGCYDEWLVEERERLRDRYVAALRRLTELNADHGRYAEAVRVGRELLRREPLQEDAYRLLMGIHQAAGDRAAAVRVYHECATTLQRELGVEPSPATKQAYADLTPPAEAAAPPDRQAWHPRGAALVGRGEEWQRLTRRWHDAEAGRAALVLVTGELGIGKTRLVEELSRWCAHRGAVVAEARSYPTEGELGYGVVISWLRSRALADRLDMAAPADRAVLTRLLPELQPVGEPFPWGLAEAEERRRLFDAAARVLTGSTRPALLVADDAQWCDAQSLALIHYAVRLEPSSSTLVVATARREELGDEHPLAAVFGGLQAIDRATEIALGRLTRRDTDVLAGRLGVDGAQRDDLYEETEGNPLFVLETVRARREGAAEGAGLTPKLQAVIAARLRQCSDTARRVLDIAATVGRAFTTDLVRAASGVDDPGFVRAVDELWRRGLVREHGADAYDFSHGKIREVAYDTLSPAARRHNHALVAEAMQRLYEGELGPVSGRVARHYDLAGRAGDAVGWYQRAAVEAQRRHASGEAVRLLERARQLVPALPGDVRAKRELQITSALPTALVGVEGFGSDRVAEAQRRAVETAGVLGVELEAPLLRSLVMSSLCRKDFDGGGAAARRLRAAAERAGDDGLLIEGDYLLGIAAFWDGRLEAARRHFESVVASFQPEQRSEHLLRFGHDPAVVCLSRLANTMWFLGEDDEARRARDRAVAMALAAGHPYSLGAAYAFAGLLAVDLGEDDRVGEYADALRRDARQPRPTQLSIDALTGYAEVLGGRADDGIRRIRSALDRCGPVDPAPGARAIHLRLLVAAVHRTGDPQAGLQATDQALGADGTRLWEPEIRRLRAELLAASGAGRRAVAAELERATALARTHGALGLEWRIERTRSRLCPVPDPGAPAALPR